MSYLFCAALGEVLKFQLSACVKLSLLFENSPLDGGLVVFPRYSLGLMQVTPRAPRSGTGIAPTGSRRVGSGAGTGGWSGSRLPWSRCGPNRIKDMIGPMVVPNGGRYPNCAEFYRYFCAKITWWGSKSKVIRFSKAVFSMVIVLESAAHTLNDFLILSAASTQGSGRVNPT